MDYRQHVHDAATAARAASRDLAAAARGQKDAALHAMGTALRDATPQILAANARDIEAARADGTPEHTIDRLRLDDERIAGIADAVAEVAGLPDPVGEVVRGSTLANGLELRQVRVPMGVIGMIYEARPNVTADAAAICLKSGNAVLLRGSSSAANSNAAIVAALRSALGEAGLPADAVQLLDAGDRASASELMRARGLVDLVIPRGGAGLIQSVVQESTVPVIETGTGNCHVYVDADADLQMAREIVVNSKTHRPSVCNAAESLLVHKAIADEFLPQVVKALQDAGVTIHGDATFAGLDPSIVPISEEDDDTEFLSMDMSARVVDSLDAAIEHVRAHGSGHTEAIVTSSLAASQEFTKGVDAAAIMVNASTRFTDGGEFGLGAEMGISTQKLHARGPMGLQEMTTTTYLVTGQGQIR